MSWPGGSAKPPPRNLTEMPPTLRNTPPRNLTEMPPTLRNSPARYRCPWEGCGKECTRRYNLMVHMRMHTGEAPYVCEYKGCTQRFKWKSSLIHHEKSHTQQRDEEDDARRHTGTFGGYPAAVAQTYFPRDVAPVEQLRNSVTPPSSSQRRTFGAERHNYVPHDLSTPIVTVSSLGTVITDEGLENDFSNSLLSFDLSHDDLSVVGDINRRLSNSEILDSEGASSGTLDRIVLPGPEGGMDHFTMRDEM